jgi:hypothetical protein
VSMIAAHRDRSRGSHSLAISLCLAVMVATLIPAGPAVAEHECTEEVETLPNGKVKIIRVCEPHEGGADGGGDGGAGGPVVTCEQIYWPLGTEPPDDRVVDGGPFYWWRGIEIREDGSTWGEGHFHCTNQDTGEEFEASWWVCFLACDGGGGPDPEEVLDGLLQQAVARVDPPPPGIRHTFDQPADDGTIRAIVNAETWWWAEADHSPILEADADGPVWARVTATPGPLTIDPGDGSDTLECLGVGLPYNRHLSYYDQVPGEARGACVHVYRDVAEAVSATMSITWTLTYEGFAPGLGNVSGTLAPITREQTATFPVKEIQSLIVR